ncbi:MAG TPA: threonine-phosphate decarboxylase CobD [Candidatus Bathyarchaeia archaeon]|nr:threonine-phosphate decarboxylase CobD [Candidatus Bathyarchaeia archaeon]
MPQNLLESDEDGLKELTSPDHGGEIWKESMELGVVPNKLLDFSANVNPLGCSPLAKMAVKRSLDLVPFYPDNECTELRRAIASYVRKIEPANIFVGNGAAEIIHLFARAFIKNGCDAIVTQPTFSEYEYATLLQRGNPIHVMRLENFELDPEMLFKNITRRTSVLFLCNPNNPTGTVQEKEIIEKIVQEAAKSNVMVLLDECFVDFVKGQTKISLSSVAKKYRNLVVLRSLTKTFGLAGLRAGYAIGHEATVRVLEKHKITWSVNTFAQVAAIAALKDMKFLNRSFQLVRKERAFLEKSLRELGMDVTPSEANFLLARLHGQVDGEELKKRLIKRRIMIRDCSRFRGLGSRFIRLAVKTRQENEALLHALRQELS